jgi:hypothetical protein
MHSSRQIERGVCQKDIKIAILEAEAKEAEANCTERTIKVCWNDTFLAQDMPLSIIPRSNKMSGTKTSSLHLTSSKATNIKA